MGGMMSLMTGGQQLLSGATALKSAKQMRDTLAAMNSNNTGLTFQPLTAPNLANIANGTNSGFTSPGALSQTGPSLDAAAAPTSVPSGAPPGFGPGINPNPL